MKNKYNIKELYPKYKMLHSLIQKVNDRNSDNAFSYIFSRITKYNTLFSNIKKMSRRSKLYFSKIILHDFIDKLDDCKVLLDSEKSFLKNYYIARRRNFIKETYNDKIPDNNRK